MIKKPPSIKTTIPVVGKLYIVNFPFKTDYFYTTTLHETKDFNIKENVTLRKGDLLLTLKTMISENYIQCFMLSGTDILKITFPNMFFKTANSRKQWISLI